MTDTKTTGQTPSGYMLYRVTIDGIVSDVVANLSATDDDAAWREVATIHGARATPAILRSLKTAYRIMPIYIVHADTSRMQQAYSAEEAIAAPNQRRFGEKMEEDEHD